MNHRAGDDIVLFVNELEYLVIQLARPVHEFTYFDHINVLAHTREHKKYVLYTKDCYILPFLQDVPMVLDQVLRGTREINEQDIDQLGFRAIWATACMRHDIDKRKNRRIRDKLWKYNFIYDALADYSWLYTRSGSVYLETTPHNPCRLQESDDNFDWKSCYASYGKDYQLLLRFTFSADILSTWAEKLTALYTLGEYNYQNRIRSINLPSPQEASHGDQHAAYSNLTSASLWHNAFIAPLDSLDICKYHDSKYGTDPEAQKEFISRIEYINATWMPS